MIDTHTHLYSKQFDKDRDLSLELAIEKGVNKFILPNIDKASYPLMLEICGKYKGICFSTLGLHPTSVKDDYIEELKFMEKEIGKHNFKAIGEIGIDCYWSTNFLEQQKEAFKIQINWAKELNLPIIIHARDSLNQIFPIMDELCSDNCKGVFHSFTGTLSDYNKIKEYKNFKLGIGGVVTFKNSSLPQIIANIDIEDIVLETDSPYLTPDPFRGKRNESAYIIYIAKKIAEIKNLPLLQVDKITTATAEKLFNI